VPASAEQTFYKKVDTSLNIKKDDIFRQLLGDLQVPILKQEDIVAQRLLLSFLFGNKFGVEEQVIKP